MKNLILTFTCALAGFGGGSLASLYVSDKLTSGIEQELFAHQTMRYNAEANASFALTDIRLAQAGDMAGIIRTNCQIARISVRLVEPNIYNNPEKRKDTAALVNRAHGTIATLEASGQCSRSNDEG